MCASARSRRPCRPVQYILIALGLEGSLSTAHRIAAARSIGHSRMSRGLLLAPSATLILVLVALNGWLFALPMGHRI